MQQPAPSCFFDAAFYLEALMDAIFGVESSKTPLEKPDVKTFMRAWRHKTKAREIVVSSDLPGGNIALRNKVWQRIDEIGA